MKSKEKVKGGDNRARGIHKPKVVTVAEGSLQSRAPGYVMPGGPDTPFPKASLGSMQSDLHGSPRNGVGTQHGAWSARQQAQRMQERGEQDRLGQLQQSAGIEQNQPAGSQQSSLGTSGSRQSAPESTPQNKVDQPSSDYGSKRSRKQPRG
ncbi:MULTISPECIES: hypothetical protein [unclassified Massilia]|uniref:hypothetical protein n=1 Tax=unclassified Massilia TaxID=2609279 RepID=UPI001B8163E7|nr:MULTISPECIES: hypothetical protein [unclassified Massilia]MBQ5942687.1 hypothetical protein [Massilia sp. AB1]MBQ5965867.1 hypothetical protein [Massilia sp. ZL223]